jgi:hypothetical protein
VNTEFSQLVTLFFFVTGIICLVFPYKIQAAALKKPAKFWGFPNPFLGFTETQGYIWMLRILRAVSIAGALFIEVLVLFGPKPNS